MELPYIINSFRSPHRSNATLCHTIQHSIRTVLHFRLKKLRHANALASIFFYRTDVSRKEEYLKTDGNNDMNEFTED